VLAYLPLAWIGQNIFSYAQARHRLHGQLPRVAVDGHQRHARDRPDLLLRAARVFEGLLTQVMIRMEDAGRLKRKMFQYFMDVARKVGADILDGRRSASATASCTGSATSSSTVRCATCSA